MTEVDKVVELLEAAGALGPRDLRDLEAAGGGKAELLIALLLAKERDHFQDLRVALEKTQPHLLSILYLNGVAGAPAAAETAGEWGRGGPAGPGEGAQEEEEGSGCPRPPPLGRGAAGLRGTLGSPPPAGAEGAGRQRAGVPLFRWVENSRVSTRALDSCAALPTLFLSLLAGSPVGTAPREVPRMLYGACRRCHPSLGLAAAPIHPLKPGAGWGLGKTVPEGVFLPRAPLGPPVVLDSRFLTGQNCETSPPPRPPLAGLQQMFE